MRFLFIVFLLPKICFAHLYYFSYQLILENSTYKTQRIYVSKVMITPKNLEKIMDFEIRIDKTMSIKAFFRKNIDTINSYLFKKGVVMNSRLQSSNKTVKNRLVLSLLPTIIDVQIKDDFAKISVYK